jgi:hypothetical protein
MPTLSASDYTSFIKAQAASQAYRNGAVPVAIQTRDQPFATQSILNAQLLASQAAYIVKSTSSTVRNNASVRPYNGYGNVNNPKSLVTLAQSGTLSSGKTQQLGGLPRIAPKGSGVYAPTPQLARVDTKATGGYRAVRQPV